MNNNKARFYEVLKYLKENSNEQHHVKTEEVLTHLNNIGFDVERKTIYDDVKTLNEMGISIETCKDGYYFDDPLFDKVEIKIILDLLNSSKFITSKKANEMENKISSLINKYDRALIGNASYSNNNNINEKIFYNIDGILKAIAAKKRIKFNYFDLGVDNNKIYRHHDYLVSPYCLVTNDNKYYVVGRTANYDNISNYRVDKMDTVEMVEEQFESKNFDINKYMCRTFGMFNGSIACVTLRVDNSLYKEMLEQFGDNLMIIEKQKEHFICSVFASISPTFFSWMFTFNGMVQVLKPNDVKKQFKEMCQRMIELHE